MNISERGLDIIREFEGYKQALPDGSCMAYQCVVGRRADGSPIYDGKWTIGYGCTKAVTKGIVWTRERAEHELRKEVSEAEGAVTRLVTVEINQNQFDALTSFAYNCGIGALQGSTLLRKLNAGDYEGAAAEFGKWVNSNGVKNVPGLVRRRREESALFLSPMSADDAPGDDMPQTVEAIEPSTREWHTEAHAALKQASGFYQANQTSVRAAGATIFATVISTARELGEWLAEHWVEVAGIALAVLIICNIAGTVQRSGWIKGQRA